MATPVRAELAKCVTAGFVKADTYVEKSKRGAGVNTPMKQELVKKSNQVAENRAPAPQSVLNAELRSELVDTAKKAQTVRVPPVNTAQKALSTPVRKDIVNKAYTLQTYVAPVVAATPAIAEKEVVAVVVALTALMALVVLVVLVLH